MALNKRKNMKRQPVKPRLEISVLVQYVKKMMLACSLLATLSLAVFYATKKANEFIHEPIGLLTIKGDFYYTDTVTIENTIRSAAEQSFVREHLETIRRAIMTSPWVDGASLARRWPNQLEVSVVEQKPIARWGNEGFVNFRGEVVKTSSLEKIQHLPLLYGAELDASAIMTQYKILSELLLVNDLTILSLNKNNLGIWQLELDNQWKIILGRSGLAEKIQSITAVLDQNILLKDDAIDTVDMRYENGFAITWDNSTPVILSDEPKEKKTVGEPS